VIRLFSEISRARLLRSERMFGAPPGARLSSTTKSATTSKTGTPISSAVRSGLRSASPQRSVTPRRESAWVRFSSTRPSVR
jgi:hypothetical protein